jgi:hypothetical protein
VVVLSAGMFLGMYFFCIKKYRIDVFYGDFNEAMQQHRFFGGSGK